MNVQMNLFNSPLFVAILVTLGLSVCSAMADSHIVKTEEVEVVTKQEASKWDKVKKESGEAAGAVGAAVKETTTKAWDATKSTSKEALQTTKEGASKAADYTSEKSSQAWDKTKGVSKEVWEATKEVTEKAADAAKEGYGDIKEKIGGSK